MQTNCVPSRVCFVPWPGKSVFLDSLMSAVESWLYFAMHVSTWIAVKRGGRYIIDLGPGFT